MNNINEQIKLESLKQAYVNGMSNDLSISTGDMNQRSLQKMAEQDAVEKANKFIDEQVEKFDNHAKELAKAAQAFANSSSCAEIRPLCNNVIIKPLDTNPFQKITKVGSLILDMGGAAPTYKNSDTGEIEEEESIVKVGMVVEIGPDCKWVHTGDCVFYPTTSILPIPFYKQGFYHICENRIVAIVNDDLKERFDK